MSQYGKLHCAMMQEMVDAGKVKYIGLSEVSIENLRKAHKIHPITAVELEWSLFSRECEEDLVPVCRELGIGILAYAPLGRGDAPSMQLLLQCTNIIPCNRSAIRMCLSEGRMMQPLCLC